jgi:2-amino-4-hydroxy-6-hydroxymethyldihydropteridine diphosphokinase
MIFIGVGANLGHPDWGPPQAICAAALGALGSGIEVLRHARWYESAPVPISDQPWYVNGLAEVATALSPADLLARLLAVETSFGRVRSVANAARTLDLDLIAYDDMVSAPGAVPILPHPRMHQRLFVLLPLAELAPDWRHPRLHRSVQELIAAVPPDDQLIRPVMRV